MGDFKLSNHTGSKGKRRGSSNRGGPRDRRGSSRGGRGRRDSREGGRGRGRRDSGRGELTMTKVTCDSCGVECEVPFKPTSSKPVYCSDCFSKNENSGSKGPSNRDLDVINEKLNKIMKALNID